MAEERYYMHPETGSVGTYDEWFYDEPDVDGNGSFRRNAVDEWKVYEVVRAHTDDPYSNIGQGDWIPRKSFEELTRDEAVRQESEEVVNIAELAYPVWNRNDSNEQYMIYQGELTELDGSLFRVAYKIPKELLYKDGKMVDILDVPYSKYVDHYEWRG